MFTRIWFQVNKPYLPLASGEYSTATGIFIVTSFAILVRISNRPADNEDIIYVGLIDAFSLVGYIHYRHLLDDLYFYVPLLLVALSIFL